MDTELRADSAQAAIGVQEMEINALMVKLGNERASAAFGQKEMAEIGALRSALSQERAVASDVRVKKTNEQVSWEAMEVVCSAFLSYVVLGVSFDDLSGSL